MTHDNEPTPERLRHAGDDVEDFITDTNKRTRRIQDTLDMLASRRKITGDQYTAGRELYDDWYKSGLAASGVVDPARIVVDGGKFEFMTDVAIDALGRFAKAIKHVKDVHAHALTNIVLIGVSLAEYAWKYEGYTDVENAKIAATTRLRAALTELDYFYYGHRKTKRGSSHAPDYRPTIPEPS